MRAIVTIPEYNEKINQGYQEMLTLVQDHREALKGWLTERQIGKVWVRVVPIATQNFFDVITELKKGNEGEIDKFAERVQKEGLLADLKKVGDDQQMKRPLKAAVLSGEILNHMMQNLQSLNIPWFTTQVESKVLSYCDLDDDGRVLLTEIKEIDYFLFDEKYGPFRNVEPVDIPKLKCALEQQYGSNAFTISGLEVLLDRLDKRIPDYRDKTIDLSGCVGIQVLALGVKQEKQKSRRLGSPFFVLFMVSAIMRAVGFLFED